MKFATESVENPDLQRVLDQITKGLNTISQFVFFGSGAPTFAPPGAAIYIDVAGGAGTTLYVWEPAAAAWAAK